MMRWRCSDDALAMRQWCIDYALMMHWWCTADALMMLWWCSDDALAMRQWCADYAPMMHWGCTVNDALMMLWWCAGNVPVMRWWCTDDALLIRWCSIWFHSTPQLHIEWLWTLDLHAQQLNEHYCCCAPCSAKILYLHFGWVRNSVAMCCTQSCATWHLIVHF